MSETKILQYVPFNSFITPNFWFKLSEIKLNVEKLNEERRHIWGFFTNKSKPYDIAILEVDCTSFNTEFSNESFLQAHGYILNKNTIEVFKDCNKLDLIDQEGSFLFQNIKNGAIFKDPSLLNTFFILSFADLKKYQFYYWFAFPTPNNLNVTLNYHKNVLSVFEEDLVEKLMENFSKIVESAQRTFFIVQRTPMDLKIMSLEAFKAISEADIDLENLFFGFSDPSMSENNPGWPLRNYLMALIYHFPKIRGKNVNILSFRLKIQKGNFDCEKSLIFNLGLPDISGDFEDILGPKKGIFQDSIWVGWEKNERGKFGPKFSDMSKSMDPRTMAENSVDLNLKLMKWRLLPDIDLEKIQGTKCLLLGSGTLGCSVARSLLGWGVRNITFVDNGKVSFSNPVRQSLFTHNDCLNGGKPKAKAAAENLEKIFPCVKTEGYQIHIPMPGHSIGDSLLEETKKSVEKITELMKNHDIIYLLMDSRESRWLPTLLGAHFQKIVINAALGFDTYLVMRHGIRNDIEIEYEVPEGLKCIPGNKLGCYFCNDITAPGNSLRDRTLDQQCTVTRPGISQIAGALAVELAISILQHKNGANAPAFYKTSTAAQTITNELNLDSSNECLLGIIPHSIRGFLSTFSTVLPATERFKNCIACSEKILDQYQQQGFDFLLEAFNSSKFLEDLTGLTEMLQDTNFEEVFEFSDSDNEISE